MNMEFSKNDTTKTVVTCDDPWYSWILKINVLKHYSQFRERRGGYNAEC